MIYLTLVFQVSLVNNQEQFVEALKEEYPIVVLKSSFKIDTDQLNIQNTVIYGNNHTIQAALKQQLFQNIINSSIHNIIFEFSLSETETFGLSQKIQDSIFDSVFIFETVISSNCFGLTKSLTHSKLQAVVLYFQIQGENQKPSTVNGIAQLIEDSILMNCSLKVDYQQNATYNVFLLGYDVKNIVITGFGVKLLSYDKPLIQNILSNSIKNATLNQLVFYYTLSKHFLITQNFTLAQQCTDFNIADLFYKSKAKYQSETNCQVQLLNNQIDIDLFLQLTIKPDYFQKSVSDLYLKIQTSNQWDYSQTYGTVYYYFKSCDAMLDGSDCQQDSCGLLQDDLVCNGQQCIYNNQFLCNCKENRNQFNQCLDCAENFMEDEFKICRKIVPNKHGKCYEAESGIVRCTCEFPYSGHKCTVNGQTYGICFSSAMFTIFIMIFAGIKAVEYHSSKQQKTIMAQLVDELELNDN
ncbi:Conserved_hypothetical protein [Hexamita inflata]|uniref:EGF-like domain-containing protein n=1 Tax=Hexamita inflata TaxID=28002 RepID=A0ABP1KQ17_9EUKA